MSRIKVDCTPVPQHMLGGGAVDKEKETKEQKIVMKLAHYNFL